MTTTISKQEQMHIDILITAIESNDWASISRYKNSVVPAFATIAELEDSGERSLGEITVTSDDIGKVVQRIASLIRAGESGNPIPHIGQDTIQAVRDSMRDPEDADFDAGMADQILQIAFFKIATGKEEIVYA